MFPRKLFIFCLFSSLAFAGSTDILTNSLLPNQGFKIVGNQEWDHLGWTVSSAGDLNGDGFHDIVATALGVRDILVIFGKQERFPSVFNSASLNGMNGFKIQAGSLASPVSIGEIVSSRGDVNGDGIDDLVIGLSFSSSLRHDYPAGAAVIFGSKQGFPATISLESLSEEQGFNIVGAKAGRFLGLIVNSGGDLNGDGVDDIVLSGYTLGDQPGEVYVVFGRKTAFESVVDLQSLSNAQGFTITSARTNDYFGYSLNLGGDVNGDGIDDLIIGAPLAESLGVFQNGAAYVVFGRRSGFTSFTISDLPSSQGFKIVGGGSQIASSVSCAGDVNGDGINDIAISELDVGISVIYGRNDGFPETIDLRDPFPKEQGMKIRSSSGTSFLNGIDVEISGDVNGDGVHDMLLASSMASLPSSQVGAAYIIFGSRSGFESEIDVTEIPIEQGYKIVGPRNGGLFGYSATIAGDINGDGLSEVIVGAIFGTPLGQAVAAGAVYVVYGHKICRDDFLSWDHTCQEVCFPPFVEGTLNGHKYCGFPCKTSKYLTWKNTCSCNCNSPHYSWTTEDGYKFCYQ